MKTKAWFLAAMLVCLAGGAKAQTVISNFPAASSVSSTDKFLLQQGGATVPYTYATLGQLGALYLPLTGGTIAGTLTVGNSGSPLVIQAGATTSLPAILSVPGSNSLSIPPVVVNGSVQIGSGTQNALTLNPGASSSAAATLAVSGTGGITSAAPFTAPGFVSMAASGAAGNGTTDDTAAINTFLAGLTNGTTVYLPAGKFYLINSGNLVVPAGIRIVGSGNPFDIAVSGALAGSGFIVNPLYTIQVDHGSQLSNLGVWRSGLIVAPSSAQVVSAVTQWGNEKSVGVTTDYNGGGIVISHVFVEGFNTGILSHDGEVVLRDDWFDDYNGVWFDQYPGDRSSMVGLRFEPFYGFSAGASAGAFARPGIALYLGGNNGGGDITNAFIFMWANGIVVPGNGWNISNSWVEWDDSAGNGITSAVGLRVINSNANKFNNLHLASDMPFSAEAGASVSLSNITASTSQSSQSDFFLGGSASQETLTVGGTIAAGNQICAILTSASIAGSPLTVCYTETAVDSDFTAAVGLANAILESNALSVAKVSATTPYNSATTNLWWDGSETVTVSVSSTGGASLTAASGAGIGGSTGMIVGARRSGSVGAHIFDLTTNTQWWTISGLGLARPSMFAGWIADSSPADGTLTLSGIPWKGDTASNLTNCGTSPSISPEANDGDGTITEGTTASACVLTFSVPFYVAPECTLSSPTGNTPISYSVSTTALTIENASASGDEFTYHCRPY